MRKFFVAAAVLATSLVGVATVADRAQAAPPTCTSGAHTGSSNRVVAGLTADGKLACFHASKPSDRSVTAITGLSPDTGLVGIDFRVQDGKLYGVGNAGGLYIIDTTTGAATKVDTLTVALSGTSFGVDFNPAANALRIVSDTGQNLRHPFATLPAATVADTTLNTGGAAPTTVTGIVGAAYTNNDLVATTATTLFDLNAATNGIAIQSTANSGVIVATGTFSPDATNGDLDVYSSTTGKNTGYALIVTATRTRLHNVDLLTGAVSNARRADDIVDIALPLDQ